MPIPSQIDGDQTRFLKLVALRKACEELRRDHLSALEVFRAPSFPGRPMRDLQARGASLPGFLRTPSKPDERSVPGRRSDPYAMRVNSTCAVLRSVLRNPAVQYRLIWPLHLVAELVAKRGDFAGNALKLGQVADLSDAIIEAVRSIESARLPKEETRTDAVAETEIDALLRRGAAQCFLQAQEDISALAGFRRAPERQVSDIDTLLSNLSFSLERYKRVCHLALRQEWSGETMLRFQRATETLLAEETTGEKIEAIESILAGQTRNQKQQFEHVDVQAYETASALLQPLLNIGAVAALKDVRGEICETYELALLLRRWCRQELVKVAKQAGRFQLLTTDYGATFGHPYVLYWMLTGLPRSPDKRIELFRSLPDEAGVPDSSRQSQELFQSLLDDARLDYHQLLALAGTGEQVDAMRLGYHLALEIEFQGQFDERLAKAALSHIVNAQKADGTFEHIDRIWLTGEGDAYGLGVELLTTLLVSMRERPDLVAELEQALSRTIDWLEREKTRPGDDPNSGWCWQDARRYDTKKPQAWATGESYSFLYLAELYFSRSLAQLARTRFGGTDHLISVEYEGSQFANLAADFWGVPKETSISEVLHNQVTRPLNVKHRYFGRHVLATRPGRERLLRSGILFGPPGTGKTTIVEYWAEVLGWPLIVLGPSHFLRLGVERVAEAATDIFEWLMELGDCLILFDEMEEFILSRRNNSSQVVPIQEGLSEQAIIECIAGTDRGVNPPGSEPFYVQRLWTTLFLPLLQQLHDRAAVIFIVATNHFNRVDAAIARPGRFDFRINVLTPTPRRKLSVVFFPALRDALRGVLSVTDPYWTDAESRLTELISRNDYLLRREDGTTRLSREPENGEQPALKLDDPGAQECEGYIPLDLFFKFLTRADTIDLARRMARQIRTAPPDDAFIPEAVERAFLESVTEISPTAFFFDPQINYLEWSRLGGRRS